MNKIYNCLTNIIKRCFITKAGSDTGQFPITQISYLDKTADCEIISPYGVYSNPPANSFGVLFHPLAEEQNRVGIFNVAGNRFKGLKENEVVTGNPITLSNIKYDNEGNVIITVKNNLQVIVDADNNITIAGAYNLTASSDSTITMPTLTINSNVIVNGTITANNSGGVVSMTGGNLTTTGSITATGNVTGQGTSLHTHVHSGVTTGGSNTGAPV